MGTVLNLVQHVAVVIPIGQVIRQAEKADLDQVLQSRVLQVRPQEGQQMHWLTNVAVIGSQRAILPRGIRQDGREVPGIDISAGVRIEVVAIREEHRALALLPAAVPGFVIYIVLDGAVRILPDELPGVFPYADLRDAVLKAGMDLDDPDGQPAGA